MYVSIIKILEFTSIKEYLLHPNSMLKVRKSLGPTRHLPDVCMVEFEHLVSQPFYNLPAEGLKNSQNFVGPA